MAIQLFHKIENSVAIVRLKGGVNKQVELYRRGNRVFIPHSGGYIRVVGQFGQAEFGTANPNIAVLEFEAEGVTLDGGKEPRFSDK